MSNKEKWFQMLTFLAGSVFEIFAIWEWQSPIELSLIETIIATFFAIIGLPLMVGASRRLRNKRNKNY